MRSEKIEFEVEATDDSQLDVNTLRPLLCPEGMDKISVQLIQDYIPV